MKYFFINSFPVCLIARITLSADKESSLSSDMTHFENAEIFHPMTCNKITCMEFDIVTSFPVSVDMENI